MGFSCSCGREIPEAVVKTALARKVPIHCKVCGAKLPVGSVIKRAAAATAPETLARTGDPSTSHEAADY
ncbi:MAG TPA: hypothetical protein VMW52_06020, partial [Phycisphaerae bacterium]|nr:hypothetical protein [Phycisphaerae bacterium]